MCSCSVAMVETQYIHIWFMDGRKKAVWTLYVVAVVSDYPFLHIRQQLCFHLKHFFFCVFSADNQCFALTAKLMGSHSLLGIQKTARFLLCYTNRSGMILRPKRVLIKIGSSGLFLDEETWLRKEHWMKIHESIFFPDSSSLKQNWSIIHVPARIFLYSCKII